MKRKLALNLRPVKTEDLSKKSFLIDDETDDSSDESYLEPLSPFIERRRPLSPATEAYLRNACALLEQLTNNKPAAKFYEELAKEDATRRRAEKRTRRQQERQDESLIAATSSQASRRPHDARDPSSKPSRKAPQSSTRGLHVSTQAPIDSATTISLKSSRGTKDRVNLKDAPANASLSARPHTATDSFDSQGTTLRPSAQGNLGHHRSVSAETASASTATFPWLPFRGSSQTDIRERLSAGPTHGSTQDVAGVGRPSSRSTRIASFIRPRSSNGSLRSSASTEGVSFDSRWSSWWKPGSLRRRNSNDSQASYRAEDEDVAPRSAAPEVDLNRALPPLPSLSTWAPLDTDETRGRPGSLHIAHLMKDFPSPLATSTAEATTKMDGESKAFNHDGKPAELPCQVRSKHGNLSYTVTRNNSDYSARESASGSPTSPRTVCHSSTTLLAGSMGASENPEQSLKLGVSSPTKSVRSREVPIPLAHRHSQSPLDTDTSRKRPQKAISPTKSSAKGLTDPPQPPDSFKKCQGQSEAGQNEGSQGNVPMPKDQIPPTKSNDKDPSEIQVVDLENLGRTSIRHGPPGFTPDSHPIVLTTPPLNIHVKAKKISLLRRHFKRFAMAGFSNGGHGSNPRVFSGFSGSTITLPGDSTSKISHGSVISPAVAAQARARVDVAAGRGTKVETGMSSIHPALRPNAAA